MIRRKSYQIAIFCAVMLTACDEWDDHNRIQDDSLNKSLLETINEDPQLSTFSQYLTTTGYDQVLASSKTFTVWAPDNDALASLSSDIVNDVDKLTEFVGNHISYQEYFTAGSGAGVRIKMLNGKNLNWYGTTLEDAPVETANKIARNGVFHIIGGDVLPKQNNWDILSSTTEGQKHLAFMQSLTYEVFVDSLGTQIGVDPDTGLPIYEPGTGYVTKNYFFDEVFDISNEDSLNTLIILTDASFDAELSKLVPYFKTVTVSQDSTDSLASWHLTKDLVIRGLIKPEELPDTLISVDGVKVPIDQSSIVETHVTSNGIVYVMSKVDFRKKDKFPPIIIEGERPAGFSRTDKDVNIHYRYREWASGNFDMRVFNHGIAQFYARYRYNGLNSMTYKVYWRTVNDFIDTTFTYTTNGNPPYAHMAAFLEKLVLEKRSVYVPSVALSPQGKDFGYVKVNHIKDDPSTNRIKYLGDYTNANYGYLNLYVVADNNTFVSTNPIEIDYIKLVPVLN